MGDNRKPKEHLIPELEDLRRRIAELEKSETERQRMEGALRESEERYRALVENATDIVFETSETGHFTFVNPAALRITGYEEEEIIGKHYLEYIRPDMRKEVSKFLVSQLENRVQNTYIEFVIITKEDREIWLGQNTQLIVKDGRFSSFQAVARDITERKHAQEALRVSETRYRLLAENARDLIWTVGLDMRLTYVSPSVTRILGFTEKEAMERTMQPAYTQESFVKAMRIFAEEMAIESAGHGDPARSRMLELDLFHKDGSTVPVEGNFCFLRDPTGKVIGILSILRDIADRKRTEELLRKSENKYRELSIVDDLTQLYNSRYFYHQLKMEMDRTDRYGQPLTLLLLDLDDFKTFNDAYGHVEGDLVLLRLGQVVKRCLRQTDSAYRYGGEEFTILLPMATSTDGAVTAERIRTEFKKETFSPIPGQDVHVTVSIGLALK